MYSTQCGDMPWSVLDNLAGVSVELADEVMDVSMFRTSCQEQTSIKGRNDQRSNNLSAEHQSFGCK